VYYWMGNTFGNLGRYDDAREHLHRALELSQESGNKETEGNAHNYLSQIDYMQGFLKRALDHAEASVRCLREIESPARLAWALVTKGLILCDLKREDDYREFLEETVARVERSGNDRTRCCLLIMNCKNFINTGQYETALKTALEGVKLAEKLGEGILSIFLFHLAGKGALYAGKTDYALQLLRRGESEGKKVGHPLGLAYIRICLAEALLRSGSVEEAMEPAEAALLFCQTLDLGSVFLNAFEINAAILAHRDPLDDTRIDKMIEQAAALVERGNSPWMKIQYLINRARIGLKRGKIEDAQKDVAEARAIYLEMGLGNGTGELRLIEEALRKSTVKGG